MIIYNDYGDHMENLNYRPPKTRVGERSFKKIIRAGKILFAKDGFQKTSINDIIAKAKVAAGTFYIYFDNKRGLYLYLLNEYRKSIRKSSALATSKLTSRYDIERAGLKTFVEYAKKDPLTYKIVWESLFVDYKIFKDYYTEFAESYIKHLKPFIESGEVRDDIDIETISYVLMGISNFIGLQIVFKENATDEEIDFVVDECMKILQNGMFR